MTEKTGAGQVPCDGCTLCCRKWHMVAMMPQHGDKPEEYETITVGDVQMLAYQENGDCIYLKDNKCSIHGRAPVVCREFDCRVVFATSTRESRRLMMKFGQESKAVYDAGRKRLPSLDTEDPMVKVMLANRRKIAQGTLDSTFKIFRKMQGNG